MDEQLGDLCVKVLRCATNNEKILDNLAGRRKSNTRSFKAGLLSLGLFVLKVIPQSFHKKILSKEADIVWSNHHFNESYGELIFIGYEGIGKRFSVPGLNIIALFLLWFRLFVRCRKSKISELDIDSGICLLYSFELALLHEIIRLYKIQRITSHGTFCRRTLALGELAEFMNITHRIIQHGAFRNLPKMHCPLVDEVWIYDDSEHRRNYFNSDTKKVVSYFFFDRKPVFSVDNPFPHFEKKIFFACNPNHIENNIVAIQAIREIHAESLIYIKPHPREDSSLYNEIASGSTIIGNESLRGFDFYVMRPSSYAVDALQSGLSVLVYIAPNDRCDDFLFRDGIEIFYSLSDLQERLLNDSYLSSKL